MTSPTARPTRKARNELRKDPDIIKSNQNQYILLI